MLAYFVSNIAYTSSFTWSGETGLESLILADTFADAVLFVLVYHYLKM